jgi:hypothetical protein
MIDTMQFLADDLATLRRAIYSLSGFQSRSLSIKISYFKILDNKSIISREIVTPSLDYCMAV